MPPTGKAILPTVHHHHRTPTPAPQTHTSLPSYTRPGEAASSHLPTLGKAILPTVHHIN
ncbi:MAG: hypothetical protein SOY07_02655 [Bacteroidales bacterium]|nr:hypothetical protein [Bacteroidales bacterium]